MGCKGITPSLVRLAGELIGKPVHIIFSHNQRNTKENVIAYLQSQGLKADQPNFTVTSSGRHPHVKGNGYVPYYYLFDHHGDLVHDHMCGDYHGGDGMECVERIEKMLKGVPVIYLGREPFKKEKKLAAKIAAAKGLSSAVKDIEKRLGSGQEEAGSVAELKRLLEGVTRHRDKELARAEAQLALRPSKVLTALGKLEKTLKGSSLSGPVTDRIKELKGSADLKAAMDMEKKYLKTLATLDRLRPCQGCKKRKQKSMSLSCPTCRNHYGPILEKVRKKLMDLASENPDLPLAKTVQAFAESLK